jgi:cytoskeletal protein CcmA (bactofilin family)
LTVGPTGVVEGNVEAPHIVIDGLVTGDVRALESIELEPNARVNGNIYYQRIEMAMGAEVNGNLVHVAADTQEAAVEVPEGNPPEQ